MGLVLKGYKFKICEVMRLGKMGEIKTSVGDRVGRLLILSKEGKEFCCQCECGTIKNISCRSVWRGKVLSCGCLQKDLFLKEITKHGKCGTKEYNSWRAMKGRCTNPNHTNYSGYGGRGIVICSRWLEPAGQGFLNFLSDMGDRPPNTSLDRINNNLGYSKENCRWSSPSCQANNRRPRVDGISGVTGVSYVKRSGKYMARSYLNGVTKYLGEYLTIIEAKEAVDRYRSTEGLEYLIANGVQVEQI